MPWNPCQLVRLCRKFTSSLTDHLVYILHPSQGLIRQNADLRIEAKEEDGTSDIEYDEQNKVVRIPLSALGPEGQRRTKLVLFTCNKCGGRTARLVNPIAWDKGAVFAQCAKCGVWHVLSAPNKKIFEEVRYNQEEQQQQQ
ncbi:hypothetical protein Vretimale_5944 [Volvox reticuliferus]|uniref:DNL-type domain-containing protein n=1 Tax=Volvox reticuliferus TaxID=1737510 RepID=A0A8J4LLP3_9CHLO|nr:hypothetical protein Vretifemale_5986 [Volvox reticuliferus]GIM01105.1 hypothetical protein Vretimale_5944 [Volvox reticuliferus]